MTKHYVEFLFPGTLFPEEQHKEIASRDAKIRWPKGAYAYRIYDREEVRKGGETLVGKPRNFSNRFVRGEVYTLDRILSEMPNEKILASNIQQYESKAAVKCVTGNWQPLFPDDVVV